LKSNIKYNFLILLFLFYRPTDPSFGAQSPVERYFKLESPYICLQNIGYGSRGFGDIIPAQSTLVFEIELLAIKGKDGSQDDSANKHEHQGDHGDTFETIDKDGNGEISSEEMGNYIKGFEEGNEEITSEDSIETIVSEIFQEDDKNKDGVISLEEFQHAGEGAGEHPDDDMEESFDGEEEGGEPRVEL